VLRTRECAPTPFPSNVFTFGLKVESIKELKGASQTTWVAMDSLFKQSNSICLLSHMFIPTWSKYPKDSIPYLASYISTKHAFSWGYESPCVDYDWNNDSVFKFFWCQLKNTLVKKIFDVGVEMMQL
jgi:hypothetical protein